MARRNRVTPEGAIIADPARGLLTGNRGILCDAAGTLVRTARGRAWICCLLEFRGHRQPLASDRSWTPLFFLDETVALAAGHRPCALCRREAYTAFRDAWARAAGTAPPKASEMDRALHDARSAPGPGAKATFRADPAALPDGTFLRGSSGPALLLGPHLLPWTPAGYGPALPRPDGAEVTVLTPRPAVAVLAAGYRPLLHPSARRA